MILFIIRHGDPIYETDSLTKKGLMQAEALPRRLAMHGIDEIYSSPMGRARLTAKPTAELLNLNIHIEEWMSESLAWDDLSIIDENGDKTWFFSKHNEILANDDPTRPDWYNHPAAKICDKAKIGYERIQAASDEFLKRLGYERHGRVYNILDANHKRIAVFCHGGLGLTWLSHLLSMPPLIFWSGFDISHSGITIIEFANHNTGITSPLCLAFSDLSHIYESGLPLEHNNRLKL